MSESSPENETKSRAKLVRNIDEAKKVIDRLEMGDEEKIDVDMDDVDTEEIKNINEYNINHKVPLSGRFYNGNYNKLRRAKLILFGESLSNYKSYKNKKYVEKTKLLKKIERACLNYAVLTANKENIIACWDNESFGWLYSSICYKVNVNLEPVGMVGNPTLAKQILQGHINIDELPKLSSLQMFPQKYVKVLARVEASKNVKKTEKYTEMYVCGKCYDNKCKMENLYNRSLDEGVNLHLICLNCGHEFNA